MSGAEGTLDLPRLVHTRLQLHFAAQLLVAINTAWLPHEDDDSHTALGWDAATGALVGGTVERATPWTAMLRVEDLTLLIEAPADERSIPLGGLTRGVALATVQAQLDDAFGPNTPRLAYPTTYEMPASRLDEGAEFDASDAEALAAWVGWFDHAHGQLTAARARRPEASPVRLWPHHFDMAVQLDLGGGRSVGVGLSCGDGSDPQPYWYVSPWPYPEARDVLPPLGARGHWHVDGFVAAVLPAEQRTAFDDAIVAPFLRTAVAAAETLAGA